MSKQEKVLWYLLGMSISVFIVAIGTSPKLHIKACINQKTYVLLCIQKLVLDAIMIK